MMAPSGGGCSKLRRRRHGRYALWRRSLCNALGGAFSGPPGGLMQPGMGEPVWPYSAHTPDVSMAPTTGERAPSGPLRLGPAYELGVFPFTQAKDGWDRMGESGLRTSAGNTRRPSIPPC